ncbi:hypothetical protein IWW48_005022 [Coemansia sp. RSA 1200]|nr:hypothetical protein IWW48_005022 [Coemansia sp. RSA 1200]
MATNSFKPTKTWYKDADKYWKAVPSSMDGMLGGLEMVHTPDMRGSSSFLAKLRSDPALLQLGTGYACDCGAGIGRVSKHFLLKHFDRVDLVEQNAQFLEMAETKYLKEERDSGTVGTMSAVGLQDFDPPEGRYDTIWCQWVLNHLTDNDMIAFLGRCARGLAPGGVVCVKENVSTRGYVVDRSDSSVTRAASIFEGLFRAAGMKIVCTQVQTGFPQGLFKVMMWALIPEATTT